MGNQYGYRAAHTQKNVHTDTMQQSEHAETQYRMEHPSVRHTLRDLYVQVNHSLMSVAKGHELVLKGPGLNVKRFT